MTAAGCLRDGAQRQCSAMCRRALVQQVSDELAQVMGGQAAVAGHLCEDAAARPRRVTAPRFVTARRK